MSRALKDAADYARTIFVLYGVSCILFACLSLTIAADHYQIFGSSKRPPNDAPLVKQVTRDVDGVFEAVEVLVEEVGEMLDSERLEDVS